MCGINGFAGDFGPTGGALLTRMNAAIAHRGPDDEGIYVDPEVPAGLGHRRLSILDLRVCESITDCGHMRDN